MIKIALILGDIIAPHRQEKLLNTFREKIKSNALPFEIHSYDTNQDNRQFSYAITAFPPKDSLINMPNLEFVLSLSLGVDTAVSQIKKKKGIRLARIVNPTAIRNTARYICWAVLEYVHLFERWKKQQKNRIWDRSLPYCHAVGAIGIMGLGKIGQVAARQLQTLGFLIKGLSLSEKFDLSFETFTDIHKFIPQINILVNLLPLTKETKDIINAKTLDLLPDHSCFIRACLQFTSVTT